MKSLLSFKFVLILLAVMFLPSLASAWTCADTASGGGWKQVPTGTKGNGVGTGDGQIQVIDGITFQCTPATPKDSGGSSSTSTSSSNSNSNSSSNSNSNSNSSVSNSGNSNQSQKQNQTQTATGGNASATGGAANATASNNSSGNSTEISNSTTYKEVHQTATAIAPDVAVTAPCTKGFGGAAQTGFIGGSFGASKVDKGCDDRETARYFATLLHNRVAAATILCNTPSAKRAHLTIEQCLLSVPEEKRVIVEVPAIQPAPVQQTPAVQPVTVNLNYTLPVVAAASETPAPVVKPAPTVKYIPYSGKYTAGDILIVEGPIELLCDAVKDLVASGVPRSAIRVRSLERYRLVHIFVAVSQ